MLGDDPVAPPVPVISKGSVGLFQLSGGPLVTAGHGGSDTILVVVPPSPSGSGTPIGGRLTLGCTTTLPTV